MVHTLFITDQEITYDGRQLSSHWMYRHFNLLGDAAVAFIGPCRVDLSEMVDIEDVKAKAPIFSLKMLHALVEFFSGDLHLTVYRQRLLMVADVQNEVVTFIDGGVGQVQLASRAPILLRVGSYRVRTGERRLSEREQFGYYPVILGRYPVPNPALRGLCSICMI